MIQWDLCYLCIFNIALYQQGHIQNEEKKTDREKKVDSYLFLKTQELMCRTNIKTL